MPVTHTSSLRYLLHKAQVLVQLVLGRHRQAEGLLDTMLRRWPGDAYALSSRAHLRHQRQDRDGALADAQALVQLHPQRSAADWFNLAYMLDATGLPEAALPAFERALALDPKLDRAWYGMGMALIRLQRLDEAVAALQRNTELQPMSPYGWYQLARVYMERQQPEQAQRILAHLQGFEPKVAAQLARETGLAV
ncbi:MAG: tetratricopeptide repeat protein [Rhodoferax sp.]